MGFQNDLGTAEVGVRPASTGAAPGRTVVTAGLVRRVAATSAATVAPHAAAAVENAASEPGAALPHGIQRRFESSLGADLGEVRVHTGPASQAAAAAVGAQAYATGKDIHFAAGRYAPDDPWGLHLLAHEVAHTVQQAGSAPATQARLEVGAVDDPAEHEADRAADAMVRGAWFTIGRAGPTIARTPESGSSGEVGTWISPLDQTAVTERASACVVLVDLKGQLDGLADFGVPECAALSARIGQQLAALPGSAALTPAEAQTLTSLGALAIGAHNHAMAELRRSYTAELGKYTGVNLAAAEDEIAEALHGMFIDDPGSNKLATLKELLGKVKGVSSKAAKAASWAAKAKPSVAVAQKLEHLEKGLSGFSGLLGEGADVLGLVDAIGTLIGKLNARPGATQGDVAKIRAGFTIVDFAIKKSHVPVIGDFWSQLIKPAADACLNGVAGLDKLAESSVKLGKFDDWWQDARAGREAPLIGASPLEKALFEKYFPGGQPMLNFMWGLMRRDVTEVPPTVESYFLKFKRQFNTGHDPSDQIDEQSNTTWYDPRTWGNRATSSNLVKWLNRNKAEAWAMIYGALPHP